MKKLRRPINNEEVGQRRGGVGGGGLRLKFLTDEQRSDAPVGCFSIPINKPRKSERERARERVVMRTLS